MGEDPNQRGLSRKHIRHAIDDSLRRLRPITSIFTKSTASITDTPMEETLEALERRRARGQGALYRRVVDVCLAIRARCWHLATQNGWARFVTMQNHYNLLYREEEREMNPLCVRKASG